MTLRIPIARGVMFGKPRLTAYDVIALHEARDRRDDWRAADQVRDVTGKTISLRRGPAHLTITIHDEEARFGPPTLRALAEVMLRAADDIEREQASPIDPGGE